MICGIRGTISRQKQLFNYHNGTVWGKVVHHTLSAYNITDVNLETTRLIKLKRNDDDDNITIQPNCNTLKSRVIIGSGYKVAFTLQRGLHDLLGFDSATLDVGNHDSDRQINITDIHSLLIRCSLVFSSYVNGSLSDVIYSFSPDKPPRSLLFIKPNNLIYNRMGKREAMSNITIRVTNQDGRLIDFNRERTTFLLHIKTMQLIGIVTTMLYRRNLLYRKKIFG